MATYNIEVNVREHKLNRSYPAILKGHYSESQFNLFCDKVDAIIQENVVPFKRSMMIFRTLSVAIPLVLMLVMYYVVFRDIDMITNNPARIPAIIMPFMFVFVAGILCYTRKIRQMSETINSKVGAVCEDASRESSSVSFHFREPQAIGTVSSNTSNGTTQIYRQGHIEVVVAGGGTSETVNAAVPFGTSTNPYASMASTSGSSPAVRLAQLDAMKHLMNDEEYEKKREEIISSV